MRYIDKRIWSLVLTIIILFNNVLTGYTANADTVFYNDVVQYNLESSELDDGNQNRYIENNLDVLKNTKSNEQLVDIKVTQPEKRRIVQNDVDNTEGFYGLVKSYSIYLRSSDTNSMDISVLTSKSRHSVSIDGSIIKPVAGKYTAAYKIDNLTEGQVISINLMDGNDILTTYTINVNISPDTSNDPHIYGELMVDKKKNISKIDIYGQNIQFVTANIKIDLKVTGKPSNDAFKGFANENGDVFVTGKQLHNDKKNYYQLNQDISIIEMSSNDGDDIELTLEKVNINSNYIDITKPVKLITLYLANNDKYVDGYNNISEIMEFDATNTYAETGYKYSSIYDTQGSNLEEEKNTFAYLVLGSLPVSVRMFIDHDSNNSRIKFEIYDHSKVPIGVVNDDYNSVVDNEFIYYLEPGEYSVHVIAEGYKTFKSNKFTIDTSVSQDGVIFYPINLLAGELDGDDENIDTVDLSKLLEVLNEDVKTPGSGFAINSSGDEIHADYNDDDIISILDLGRLLRNMGVKYKSEDLTPVL